MSSLSSDTAPSHQITSNAESAMMNGFVAGLAGSSLYDEVNHHQPVTAGPTRTIRLSANSGSIEEADYVAAVSSPISESHTINEEEEEEEGSFEMRISEGSSYPSKFSLLNLSSDSSATLEITNCSTIDATLETSVHSLGVEEVSLVVEEQGPSAVELEGDVASEEQEEVSVFSPASCSSFGEFKGDDEGSECSADSFGDFDSVLPTDKQQPLPDPTSLTSLCYGSLTPASYYVLHSSPKKILDNNFIWAQARANVTKPSYTWEKLKLHSYLLGSLSVRQPISLNRLKQNSSVTNTSSVSSGVPRSPAPCSVTPSESPEDDRDSVSVNDWESDISSVSGRSSAPPPPGGGEQCCRPCVPSILQRKLHQHRRSHSSPIPASGEQGSPSQLRALSSSPLSGGLTKKGGSLEGVPSATAFDEVHATRGLGRLSFEELQTMRQEMKARVSELSTTLIVEFQYRGEADHAREVKKAFVSAFLLAEEKKSQGALAMRQKSLMPVVCTDFCPSTEMLVLLTQLLSGLVCDTPHTADLLKQYIVMLCKTLD